MGLRNQELIPKQEKGGHVDILEIKHFGLDSEAILFYQNMEARFLNINTWHKVCKSTLSKFYLVDSNNQLIEGNPKIGLYIKIDIPGPSTKMGAGFDWVIIRNVTYIEEINYQAIYIVVQPAPNPINNGQETSHFYTADASSTFIISRAGNTVKAEVHGRNEIVNSQTSIISDNLRNMIVGMSAKVGFSYPQWKSLAKGLIA